MNSIQETVSALSALTASQLKSEWKRQMRSDPPDISIDLLERALAYELQARVMGGLPPMRRRELEKLARQLDRSGGLRSPRDVSLRPGTRLARDWHGRTHHVFVTEQGFLYEERCYLSLSQVATAITGTKWSGPRFFGLRRPTKEAALENGQN